MTAYAVGDLQGCHAEFVELLERLSFRPGRDELWLAGDLVNRGPASLECLREIMALGNSARPVLGNHDLHLLAVARGNGRIKPHDTLQAVLAADDREAMLDWLQSRPLVVCQGDTLMCHAGLLPSWGQAQAAALADEVHSLLVSESAGEFLAQMYGNDPDRWDESLQGTNRHRVIVNTLTRMRFIDAEGRLSFAAKQGLDSAPAGYRPWFQYPRCDDIRILFGHWAALSGTTPGSQVRAEALDTGCVWGGSLTAINLESGERISVPAGGSAFKH
ncbi:symmetrical bis(5'-nucleosyl)-tetraphosphatase [Halomonas halocynthiae]|uniref:symmetrical bis(5'-nucleosyl)-tetraphosphatase n=1 Tax=Halomonas halocynthiae TaxID=176290 RepID=UPI00040E2E0C|nr:symmetrical bis(5'-nucleosyl)-tetraphosphatase [Halomonas halocynthiae]